MSSSGLINKAAGGRKRLVDFFQFSVRPEFERVAHIPHIQSAVRSVLCRCIYSYLRVSHRTDVTNSHPLTGGTS